MNNEEKKNFSISMNKMYRKYMPYESKFTLDEIIAKENEYWFEFEKMLFKLIPLKLYKFREVNENTIKCLEEDTAWFSNPKDFSDTKDTQLNIDIKAEIDNIRNNPRLVHKRLSKNMVLEYARTYNVDIDVNLIEEIFKINNDKLLDKYEIKRYLKNHFPDDIANHIVSKIDKNNEAIVSNNIKEATIGYLTDFMNFNQKLRNEVYVLSLTEDVNNQSMWDNYADHSKGFCIEYSFSKDTILGQRMLMNMNPIYYGEKPYISVFEILQKGLYLKDGSNRISDEDYMNIYISTFTKDMSFSNELEWRITLDKRFGGNLQPLPFVTSIILGENITDKDADKLILIAKKKNISVYKRESIFDGSKVTINKIL